MRRILNSCVVGSCGLLLIACGSSSKPTDTVKTSAPAEEMPSVVAADPIERPAAEIEPDDRASLDTPATRADSATYPSTEPGMAPQGGQSGTQQPAALAQTGPTIAVAVLEDAKGKEVGQVRFEQEGQRVIMSGEFTGLPKGERGIQMKTNGDCGGKGHSRAGADFNPTKSKHGPPSSGKRHVGDFGNIKVADDGTATFSMKTDAMTVYDGGTSIVGRSIVITARADDGKTQPSGNAGAAIACGVIRAEGSADAD
ncbi:MAG TPA: superoxide dismutase family protein [Kofleriaceae bacterium]|nr:superoxide dismutase family protein [Kofleriaceae bacterium]